MSYNQSSNETPTRLGYWPSLYTVRASQRVPGVCLLSIKESDGMSHTQVMIYIGQTVDNIAHIYQNSCGTKNSNNVASEIYGNLLWYVDY